MNKCGIPKFYGQPCNWERSINPYVLTIAAAEQKIKEKQDRLVDLRAENAKYPSLETEKQIKKVEEIISNLYATIQREKERGGK